MKGEIKANVQICKFPKLLSSLSLTLWHSFDKCRLICASFFPLALEALSMGAMTSGSPSKDKLRPALPLSSWLLFQEYC